MEVLIRTYEGKDLVIPSKAIEELGVKPGETVVIRPRVALKPAKLSASERERRLKVLELLYGAWTSEDEFAFKQLRQEMWKNWTTRNLL
jgi:hypothetical protein